MGILTADPSNHKPQEIGPKTMRLKSLPIFLLASAPFADPVYAATINDLGNLTGADFSYATDISSDGSIIIGDGGFTGYRYHAFRWTESGGMVDLGFMSGTHSCSAFGISSDGSTVVGYCNQTGNSTPNAFTWSQNNLSVGQFVALDPLTTGEGAGAFAASETGSIVVGYSTEIVSGIYIRRAVLWDQGTIRNLVNLSDREAISSSSAYGVSADGTVVVGSMLVDPNLEINHAFRWTAADGMVDIMTNADANVLAFGSSEATDVSANGNVVVGMLGYYAGAFRWTATTGMVDLGYLDSSNDTVANGVSADGSIVVGYSGVDGGSYHAFSWTLEGGMIDLGTLTGGTMSYANAITDDGTLIVGFSDNADGDGHAVVWTAGAAIDINNTSAAIAQTATNTQAFFDQRSAALSAGMARDCDSFGANGLCVSLGGRATSVQDGFTDTVGVLNVGYRVSDTLRVGAFIDDGSTSASSNSFSVGSSKPAFGAFAAYSEGSDGKGLQSRFSAAWHSDTVDITRAVLSDTEAGRGQANVDASMVSAEVGYGMVISPTMMATPFAGWHYGSVTRDAYSEGASDTVALPISYAAFSQKQSSAVLGTRLDAVISDDLTLLFQVGGEVELSSSRTSFAGNSGIPGLTGFGLNDDGAGDEVRVFGSAGARYDLDKNQRLIATVLGSGQLNGNAGYTVMAGYQIGF